MKKIALITGATSGIGKHTALKLADKGYDLILIGRRATLLRELEDDIQSKYDSKVLPLGLDISKFKEVEDALFNNLPDEWSAIDVLINNAGVGINFGPIHEGNVEDWDTMIDTNLKGLLYVSRMVIPGMVERKTGHIINMGSMLSRRGVPNMAVYSATKHAVNGLCRDMRLDLQKYDIRVTQILPARVKTGFAEISFGGDKQRTEKSYGEFTPLYTENIADAIIYALSQPPHVEILDVAMIAQKQL